MSAQRDVDARLISNRKLRASAPRLNHTSKEALLKMSADLFRRLHRSFILDAKAAARAEALLGDVLSGARELPAKKDPLARFFDHPDTIGNLEVETRTCNLLVRDKVRTVEDLCRISEPELLARRGFGEASVADIKQALWLRGRTLRVES